MTNLLSETLSGIADSGHTVEDIVFIGSRDGHECTWDEFAVLADFEYNNSYGAAEIPTDLIVVFSDGSNMHRGEYDGSEWWEYSRPFVRPDVRKPIHNLGRDKRLMWASLEEAQEVATDA